jgi:hypothetical protein
MQRASAVHGLWLFQVAQRVAQSMPADAAQKLAALLMRTGGQDVMALALPRQIERRNNVLVLE